MAQTLALAYEYKDRGFAPVPVPYMRKHCRLKDWPNLIIPREQFAEAFKDDNSNIGILLGQPSGGLADVDLDCEPAIALAQHFLPATGMVFGRESRPKSHWIYKVSGPASREVFNDPEGEEVRFDTDGDPLPIDLDQLMAYTRHLAAATLVLRHWKPGQRHFLALAVSGTLIKGGLHPREVARLIDAIVRTARDEEAEDRLRCVETTAEELRTGRPITGKSELTAIIGERATSRFCEWMGL